MRLYQVGLGIGWLLIVARSRGRANVIYRDSVGHDNVDFIDIRTRVLPDDVSGEPEGVLRNDHPAWERMNKEAEGDA